MPIKGLEPQRPFPKKFYPRFTRGPVHIAELQQKENKIGNSFGNHIQDPVKGEIEFSPEMGKWFSVVSVTNLLKQQEKLNSFL